jgi:hypothetical protein
MSMRPHTQKTLIFMLWISFCYNNNKNQDSIVSIVTGYRLDGRWVEVRVLTSNQHKGQEYEDPYIHYPINLHGIVLN